MTEAVGGWSAVGWVGWVGWVGEAGGVEEVVDGLGEVHGFAVGAGPADVGLEVESGQVGGARLGGCEGLVGEDGAVGPADLEGAVAGQFHGETALVDLVVVEPAQGAAVGGGVFA